jgi:hypothetical protein
MTKPQEILAGSHGYLVFAATHPGTYRFRAQAEGAPAPFIVTVTFLAP